MLVLMSMLSPHLPQYTKKGRAATAIGLQQLSASRASQLALPSFILAGHWLPVLHAAVGLGCDPTHRLGHDSSGCIVDLENAYT